MHGNGPALVMLYRLIIGESGSSFAWWNGQEWVPDGEVHCRAHDALKIMGAVCIMRDDRVPSIMEEIWVLGG